MTQTITSGDVGTGAEGRNVLNYSGGLRMRLIHDSIVAYVTAGLTALGWLDSGRRHAPLSIRDEPQNTDVEVALNTLAISDEAMSTTDAEIGSSLGDHRWVHYVDFFAESDALGLHVIHDVKALLDGRFPSQGFGVAYIPVYDYTMATPSVVFWVEMESARIDRAHNFPHLWLRHWFSCQFVTIDTYGGDEDGFVPPPSVPNLIGSGTIGGGKIGGP